MRYIKWTISRDTAEGASPQIYEMQCTTCHEQSTASENPDDPHDWALTHSGRNPTHRGYRGIATSFWRTTMPGEDQAPAAFIGRRDGAPTIGQAR
jgi:hypothetical protein